MNQEGCVLIRVLCLRGWEEISGEGEIGIEVVCEEEDRSEWEEIIGEVEESVESMSSGGGTNKGILCTGTELIWFLKGKEFF